MPGLTGAGRSLIVLGLVLIVVGLIVTFAGKIPGIGRLPGDIYIKRGNFRFYFPLATSILLSLLLSILLNIFRR